MAPIQVLVNNLLYDFSQLGIPTDVVDEEYLQQPRKWNIESIKKFMIFIGPDQLDLRLHNFLSLCSMSITASTIITLIQQRP